MFYELRGAYEWYAGVVDIKPFLVLLTLKLQQQLTDLRGCNGVAGNLSACSYGTR